VRNKFYVQPGCPFCGQAREYLRRKGVDYVELDVTRDRRALAQLLSMTGRREVPAIIAGDRAVIGFDPPEWDSFLVYSEELQRHDPYVLPASLGRDPYEGVD
jgi:glutaredoxin 3